MAANPTTPTPAPDAPPALPRALPPLLSQRCVAVCDDDIRFIRLIERLLGEANVDVVPVTTLDPNDAVRVIAEEACGAALIDLNIYNDDHAGLTLVRLLRQHPATAGLPLVLATATAPRDLRRHEAFLRDFGCAVLSKPFSAEALFAVLGLCVPSAPAA